MQRLNFLLETFIGLKKITIISRLTRTNSEITPTHNTWEKFKNYFF